MIADDLIDALLAESGGNPYSKSYEILRDHGWRYQGSGHYHTHPKKPLHVMYALPDGGIAHAKRAKGSSYDSAPTSIHRTDSEDSSRAYLTKLHSK